MDEYTMTGKAKTDLTVLKLSLDRLSKVREKYDRFDEIMMEFEDYVDENKAPYCDYKRHVDDDEFTTPIEQFQHCVNKVQKIVKSYKAATFTEFIMDLKQDKKKKQALRDHRRKEMNLKTSKMATEERNEQAIGVLNKKVDTLMSIVSLQQRTMTVMHNELLSKLNRIQGKLFSLASIQINLRS